MTEFNQQVVEAAERNGWTLLHKGDTWQPGRTGRGVIVGYEPWSGPDVSAVLRLVGRGDIEQIAIFVLDDVDDLWPLDSLMPGAPQPLMKPVAAEYRYGVWATFAQGQAVVDLLDHHT